MPGKENHSIEVLHQDEQLIAVNKLPGIATNPGGWQPDQLNLVDMLSQEFGKIYLVHRLDKETSGVVLFARNAEAHRLLNDQFSERRIRKVYHAFIHGTPEWDNLDIAFPLRVNVGHKHKTVIDHDNGKSAVTSVKVLERFGPYSLIEAVPHSGYTHQIRAHLAAVNSPILFDPVYGRAILAGSIPAHARLALHASQISFLHPAGGQLTISAPFLPDWEELMRWIRRIG